MRGTSVRDVGFGFPLFFALMIEIVTAFGPITLVRFAELTATPTSTSRRETGHGPSCGCVRSQDFSLTG